MRIYVSGPITGHEQECRPRFSEAAAALERAGHEAVNPCAVCPPDTARADAMRRDIRLLLDCDGVALLEGWRESDGASLEYLIAEAIGIEAKPLDRWTGGGPDVA